MRGDDRRTLVVTVVEGQRQDCKDTCLKSGRMLPIYYIDESGHSDLYDEMISATGGSVIECDGCSARLHTASTLCSADR